MSKAYGLAGLRVCYAVGPARLIAEIEKSRGPYKVSGIAEAAALAALREREWVTDRIAQVRDNRARLAAGMRARGVHTWDSAANFLLMQVPGSAADWNRRLRELGVAVRPFDGLTGAGGACIRVSVGPWSMMEAFLNAFDEVYSTMTGDQ
jgi:histidinol-phosphate aminotransferase